MLKMTSVLLELVASIEMYQFIKNGVRGEVSYMSKRQNIANNKYMKLYDQHKSSIYMVCVDENNLNE